MYTGKYKGKYRVRYPLKYKGDIQDIIYRSSWELKFMKWCDLNPNVMEWGSETVVIPYYSPVDKRIHRYFVDFYIKVKESNNRITKYLIEIKPEKFTKPPSKPDRKSKKFLEEVLQYGINQAKWESANEFCLDRGMKFLVLTEKDLGISS